MRKRRVAIVYNNPLFAHGIASLLHAEPRLEICCLEAGPEVTSEKLIHWQPEVIVAEHDGEGSAVHRTSWDRVGGENAPLIIAVGLRDSGMELFYSRRVVTATPDTLLEAVLDGAPGGRRTSDGRRSHRAPGSANHRTG